MMKVTRVSGNVLNKRVDDNRCTLVKFPENECVWDYPQSAVFSIIEYEDEEGMRCISKYDDNFCDELRNPVFENHELVSFNVSKWMPIMQSYNPKSEACPWEDLF